MPSLQLSRQYMILARYQLITAETNIDLAISAIPTGGTRDKLTEANILLKQALQMLESDLRT